MGTRVPDAEMRKDEIVNDSLVLLVHSRRDCDIRFDPPVVNPPLQPSEKRPIAPHNSNRNRYLPVHPQQTGERLPTDGRARLQKHRSDLVDEGGAYLPDISADRERTRVTPWLEAWPTPVGRTVINAKIRYPVWIPPPDIRAEHAELGDILPPVVPSGPNNPMGLFELATGFSGIYIHGANRPWSVGGIASHGCIRLYPEYVAELFRRVPLGTEVRIIDQPYRFGSLGGRPYLAASPLLQERQAGAVPSQDVVSAWITYSSGRQVPVDWDRLMAAAKLAQGVPTPIGRGSRSLAEEVANAR